VAFPGTYNFNYYQGDTLEFKVYPKLQTGAAFPGLNGFTAKFTVATARGTTNSPTQYTGYTRVESDHIVCAVTPDLLLPAGTLVYDVEIAKEQDSPYSLVYTLLTGSMSVTQQVTSGSYEAPLVTPGPVLNVSATASSTSQVDVSWQAPETGGAPSAYVVRYAIASDPTTIIQTVNKTSLEFSHSFTGLTANTQYVFGVYATNTATQGTPTAVTDTATTLPEAPGQPRDFTVVDVTNSTIEISWLAPLSLDQTGYIFYLDDSVVGNTEDPNATSYTFTGLSPSTQYKVEVAAFNVGGAGTKAGQTLSTSA
jgi:hypothetical protein